MIPASHSNPIGSQTFTMALIIGNTTQPLAGFKNAMVDVLFPAPWQIARYPNAMSINAFVFRGN